MTPFVLAIVSAAVDRPPPCRPVLEGNSVRRLEHRGRDSAAGGKGATARAVERGTVACAVAVVLCMASVVLVIPLLGGWITTFTSVAIYSVVAAGLGILYGRVGMISLCQIALLAIGTWVAARFLILRDLPFPGAAHPAITAAVGVLIGLPALRLTGLHLALITLMAAGAVTVILPTT